MGEGANEGGGCFFPYLDKRRARDALRLRSYNVEHTRVSPLQVGPHPTWCAVQSLVIPPVKHAQTSVQPARTANAPSRGPRPSHALNHRPFADCWGHAPAPNNRAGGSPRAAGAKPQRRRLGDAHHCGPRPFLILSTLAPGASPLSVRLPTPAAVRGQARRPIGRLCFGHATPCPTSRE